MSWAIAGGYRTLEFGGKLAVIAIPCDGKPLSAGPCVNRNDLKTRQAPVIRDTLNEFEASKDVFNRPRRVFRAKSGQKVITN